MKLLRELFTPSSWRLAYRDAKPQWKSLLLYTSSMIAGIAALVAILSFRSDVLLTVDEQSKELLGADLEMDSNQPYPEEAIAFIDSIGGSDANSIEFNSMVLFKNNGSTRLSQIRAIEGPFPLYGTLKTEPESAADRYKEEKFAIVEQSALNQYAAQVGDSIQVGNTTLLIGGALISVPGEAAAFSLIGPRVYIPKSVIEDSGLLQRGSRVEYKQYFKFDSDEKAAEIEEAFDPISDKYRIRTETVQEEKEEFEEVVNGMSKFLGLIAFIAILLGGLGVSSAVYVYIKRKSNTVATLRCLGITKEKILATFAIQISIIGMMGAVIGTGVGIFIQLYIPSLFEDLLPFQIVQSLSIPAVALGLSTGLLISLVFSLLPLVTISTISPLLTLRTIEFSPIKALSKRAKIITFSSTFLILTVVVGLLTESFLVALGFTAGLLACVFLLWLVAALLIFTIKKLRLKTFSYTVRQGMANLFRPNNQTSMLMITLGMGMLLIGTLYMSQDMLLQRINLETGENMPDAVFYDIQIDQNDPFLDIIEESGAETILNVPIVSMRLASRKGVPVSELRADTTDDISGWALSREYRVTYRDYLTESETIIDGEWIGEADGIDSVVPISVADQIDDDLKIEVGDTLGFNVQGVPVTTVVASIREVDFQRPEPNFFIVFPKGVLESAPQFFASTVRTNSREQTISLQQQVTARFPNISSIDISVALQSVRDFLDKMAVGIQFMAFFSILTGFIVL
ncbi:MAG: FtsX-like permease family protein, partial [Balneolaceae bacterium]|nr:FtsX-like permease family protein [Balneolaceae bacterium]